MGYPEMGLEDLHRALVMVLVLSFSITYLTIPWVMRKMRDAGMVGEDVNKRRRPDVPEMGGIAVVFGFTITLTVTVGIRKLIGEEYEVPVLAVIGVFFVASTIGIFDDISVLRRREKATLVIFASLPLIIAHNATAPEVLLPFGNSIFFNDVFIVYLFYWLVIVPLGITGAANAINLSAGYNGLESGEVVVISLFMAITALVLEGRHPSETVLTEQTAIILISLTGSALALYTFNRVPARTFVGDTGTLGMGAVIGAAVILGNIQFYGIICILPAFYEMAATVYYSAKRIERRDACMNPVVGRDGTLSPPKGAERYTLAYLILSRRPMTEARLVRTLLLLYAASGALAVGLAFLG
ncbi:MAG: hypothetical protein L0Z54_05975 [Thermoplasmata archaeon]|nr:hypothetical protein [Thermoplasmata archaeon]